MMNRILLLLGCLTSTSHAFLAPKPQSLSEITKSLDGTQFDWQFSVGVDQRFPLHGLQTKILGNEVSVVEQAHFTGMKGREAVTIESGKWDLSWRDTSPRGCLTFELEVPESVSLVGCACVDCIVCLLCVSPNLFLHEKGSPQ